MKIKLLLLLLLFFSISSFSQQKLVFNYDTAGNQILRERLCINCTQVKSQDIETKDSLSLAQKPKVITNEELAAEENDLRINAYPNPVTDVLQVQWLEHPIMEPQQILLYSRDNRYLQKITLSKNQNIQDIIFNRYPTGTYILVVVFENGQRRSFQIIKK